MLYLHYGKQFVKTVLSASSSDDAGRRLSCAPEVSGMRYIVIRCVIRGLGVFEKKFRKPFDRCTEDTVVIIFFLGEIVRKARILFVQLRIANCYL